MEGNTPEQSHQLWLDTKRAQGWTHGQGEGTPRRRRTRASCPTRSCRRSRSSRTTCSRRSSRPSSDSPTQRSIWRGVVSPSAPGTHEAAETVYGIPVRVRPAASEREPWSSGRGPSLPDDAVGHDARGAPVGVALEDRAVVVAGRDRNTTPRRRKRPGTSPPGRGTPSTSTSAGAWR